MAGNMKWWDYRLDLLLTAADNRVIIGHEPKRNRFRGA
jgi:hypothetical protein